MKSASRILRCLEMQVVMEKFKRWCELLSIKGIIDGIHIVTTKLIRAFANDYYYKT
jgi:hypothetical protein